MMTLYAEQAIYPYEFRGCGSKCGRAHVFYGSKGYLAIDGYSK
jgi:hypothetical protein